MTKEDVIKHAEDIFGDKSKALWWLTSPKASLGNLTPMYCLGPKFGEGPYGVQLINDILTRLQCGIYS